MTCSTRRVRRPPRAIWGAGSKGVAFLTTLASGEEVAHAVDINPYKQGKYLAGTGHEVAGAGALRNGRPTS